MEPDLTVCENVRFEMRDDVPGLAFSKDSIIIEKSRPDKVLVLNFFWALSMSESSSIFDPWVQ